MQHELAAVDTVNLKAVLYPHDHRPITHHFARLVVEPLTLHGHIILVGVRWDIAADCGAYGQALARLGQGHHSECPAV